LEICRDWEGGDVDPGVCRRGVDLLPEDGLQQDEGDDDGDGGEELTEQRPGLPGLEAQVLAEEGLVRAGLADDVVNVGVGGRVVARILLGLRGARGRQLALL